jgi:hypothetical protein
LGRVYRAPGPAKGWIVERPASYQWDDRVYRTFVRVAGLARSEEAALERLAEAWGLAPLPDGGRLPPDLARYEAHWVIGQRYFPHRALCHLEARPEGHPGDGDSAPRGPAGLTKTACGRRITPKRSVFHKLLAGDGGTSLILCPICVERAQEQGVPVPPGRVGRSRRDERLAGERA